LNGRIGTLPKTSGILASLRSKFVPAAMTVRAVLIIDPFVVLPF